MFEQSEITMRCHDIFNDILKFSQNCCNSKKAMSAAHFNCRSFSFFYMPAFQALNVFVCFAILSYTALILGMCCAVCVCVCVCFAVSRDFAGAV